MPLEHAGTTSLDTLHRRTLEEHTEGTGRRWSGGGEERKEARGGADASVLLLNQHRGRQS